jgi:hypothetical protein
MICLAPYSFWSSCKAVWFEERGTLMFCFLAAIAVNAGNCKLLKHEKRGSFPCVQVLDAMMHAQPSSGSCSHAALKSYA